MPLLRRADRTGAPRRQWGRLALRWIVPIVGGVTPVLLIAINVAAFMVKHLDQFRWTITVLAFLSGMMLNTYLALKIYRFAQRRLPGVPVVNEHNEEIVIVIGMGVITVFTFILAWLCYRGLENPNDLPNGFTFFYGFFQIALPFGYKLFFDWDRGRGRRAEGSDRRRVQAAQPAPPQASTTPAGYTPPPWLPPS